MTTFTSRTSLPKQVPAFPRSKAVLSDAFKRIRADYPAVTGLTHVTKDAAIFQAVGDSTRYCLRITPEESAALGYVAI